MSRMSGAFGRDHKKRDNLSMSPHSSRVSHTLEICSCEKGTGDVDDFVVIGDVGVRIERCNSFTDDGCCW